MCRKSSDILESVVFASVFLVTRSLGLWCALSQPSPFCLRQCCAEFCFHASQRQGRKELVHAANCSASPPFILIPIRFHFMGYVQTPTQSSVLAPTPHPHRRPGLSCRMHAEKEKKFPLLYGCRLHVRPARTHSRSGNSRE